MTDDLHSLAAAYALGALDADEQSAFEAHLASCSECAAEVDSFGDVVESLAESGSVAPPDHLKASIMAQLGDVPQELRAPAVDAVPSVASVHDAPGEDRADVVDLGERRRRKFSTTGLLAAAAAVVVIAVGAIVITADRGGTGFDDVLAADDAVVTQLDGEDGSFEVVYSAELDQVALRGQGVDDLPPNLRYALWAIADGTPIPAGLFEADDGEVDEVAALADVTAEAWGITVEPETGSDQPTGEIIYFAEV